MPERRSYVPYTNSVESPATDKTEVIGDIVWSIARGRQNGAARYGNTVCASHSTSTEPLKGNPQVLDGLLPTLVNGLFVRLRIHFITVHLAQGSDEVLSDACPSVGVKISSGEP